MSVFKSTDILIPNNVEMEKWAVIACDQYTSDPAYWQQVRQNAGEAPSTIHMILPEAELGSEKEEQTVKNINAAMEELKKKGSLTIPGRVSRRYFEEKFYGLRDRQ